MGSEPTTTATTNESETETVRLRPAAMEDVNAIHELLQVVAQTTSVLPRSVENVVEHVRDFAVGVHEDRVVACGALCVFTTALAEIKSLAVAPEWRRKGVGARLVRAFVEESRRLGIRRVFALTDNVPFFERLGFSRVDKETLPQKVWNECVRCPKLMHCTEEAVEMILPQPADRTGAWAGLRNM